MFNLILGNLTFTTVTFDKGSLILVDYTAKIKDTGEVFDTTRSDDAEQHSIFDSSIAYQPRLFSIHEFTFPALKGLDEGLANTSVGDKLTIEVTPEDGFGMRDSGNVRMIPIRKLGEDADKISVGDTIEIDNRPGIIRFIGSGRVQIDYNHKYAGKTIVYDVHVIRSLEKPEEKISAVLEHFFPDEDEILFELADYTLLIPLPEKFVGRDNIQATKFSIQANIFKIVPTLTAINFLETYVNKSIPPPNPQEAPSSPDVAASEPTPETIPSESETTKSL